MTNRLSALLVVIALLSVGCATRRFPVEAVSVLRAAGHVSAGAVGEFEGSLAVDGAKLVRLEGRIDTRNDRASITTTDTASPPRYPAYEGRYVDGWSYIAIASTVRRPPRLDPRVGWVAFRGITAASQLPIPDRTSDPGVLIGVLDRLRSQPITNARFIGPPRYASTIVQFLVPNPPSASGYTLSAMAFTLVLDARGRIAEVTIADRVTGPTDSYEQDADFAISWVDHVNPIQAPPTGDVQRLAPGENLYAPPSGP